MKRLILKSIFCDNDVSEGQTEIDFKNDLNKTKDENKVISGRPDDEGPVTKQQRKNFNSQQRNSEARKEQSKRDQLSSALISYGISSNKVNLVIHHIENILGITID